MIYEAYVLGREGLTWASCSYWIGEGHPAGAELAGPLVSSLVSLSDVTLKGRVKSITTESRSLFLKINDESPSFAAAVIADQADTEDLAKPFLERIYSKTDALLTEEEGQVGTGFLYPEFVEKLETEIDQEYNKLIYPPSGKAQKLGRELFHYLEWTDSEDTLTQIKTLREQAVKERKESYQTFQDNRENYLTSEISRETIIKHFYELNVERMLAHARWLKENTENGTNALIWIITGVYLNRLSLEHPAPPPSTLLQEISRIRNALPTPLKAFLDLAKLELKAKTSLKESVAYHHYLRNNAASLLNKALNQDSPLDALLAILLVGWHPESMKSRVIEKVRELFDVGADPLSVYLQTLRKACKIYTISEGKKTKTDPSTMENLVKIIPEIHTKGKEGRVEKLSKAKLFQYTILASLEFLSFNWLETDLKQLKSLMKLYMKNFEYFLENMELNLPFSFLPMQIPLLILEKALLRFSNLSSKAKKRLLNHVFDIHSQLAKSLIKHFYGGRGNALQTYKFLSSSLLNASESSLLGERSKQPTFASPTLVFLFNERLKALKADTSLAKDILANLLATCAFLAPYISVTLFRESYVEKVDPLLLRIVRQLREHPSLDMLLQSTFKFQKIYDSNDPIAYFRMKNCEFLLESLLEGNNVSPFYEGLLRVALGEGQLSISEPYKETHEKALENIESAIELWEEAGGPKKRLTALKKHFKKLSS